MKTSVLSAESLGKRFGRRQVLKGADFEVPAGGVLAIMGRNGSGKSTLLDLAAGARRPDFGTVRFARRIWERPRLPTLARLGLYYLHQRPPLSARFRIGAYFQATVRRFGNQALGRAMELLRLEPLLDRYSDNLSGGEMARVGVGLAMTRRPSCLLADEPFAGVAPLDQEVLAAALQAMADEGTAIVVTGHDVPVLFGCATDVVWVVDGTTIHLGTPEAAVADERFRRDYLGSASRLTDPG